MSCSLMQSRFFSLSLFRLSCHCESFSSERELRRLRLRSFLQHPGVVVNQKHFMARTALGSRTRKPTRTISALFYDLQCHAFGLFGARQTKAVHKTTGLLESTSRLLRCSHMSLIRGQRSMMAAID
ncbi:hypothetical protein DFH06DRAFT_1205315 [Mycena polygramma]|nr:hypothetical protein DFH06DRAFT_1205315 [Mycena polygramma]